MKMNGKPNYQVLPDLPPDEFESLKSDISENGLNYPLLQDELGHTIDSHQRERALDELGIKNYPIKTIAGLSEEEKFHLALTVNIKRRHLTSKQKREVIAQELRRTPDYSNNWLAEILGVDHKTIQAVRRKLESSREIPKLKKLRGKDGKQRRHATIHTETASDAARAQETLRELDGYAPAKTLTLKRARELKREKRYIEAARRELAPPRRNTRIQLHHCDFKDLPVKANSVQLLCTDPPWDKRTLPVWPKLAAFAKRVLVSGGFFASYVPIAFLPEVMDALGERLTYQWCVSIFRGDPCPMVFPQDVMNGWRPVLIYSRGKVKKIGMRDFLTFPQNKWSKNHHPWQQGLDEAVYLIDRLCRPGGLVCDPCGGSFTVAAACKTLGNRKFVGCDIDKAAVAIGRERLAEVRTSGRK